MAYNNSLDLTVTGVVTASGTGTFTGSAVTQYEVVLGDASNALTNVSGVGTLNQYLASNGASMAPTWKTLPGAASFSINTQVFTTSGTYTPSANLAYAIVEVIGDGGGGGACPTTSVNCASASGGGAGGYARKTLSAATIGASQTVTIGTGGAGGAVGNNPGTAGTGSSFGSLVTASAGSGGQGGTSGSTGNVALLGGAGGVGASGDINISGGYGGASYALYNIGAPSANLSGSGGSSFYGVGGQAAVIVGNGQGAGNNGVSYGSGGSGAATANGTQSAGGNGAPGLVVVTEFIYI